MSHAVPFSNIMHSFEQLLKLHHYKSSTSPSNEVFKIKYYKGLLKQLDTWRLQQPGQSEHTIITSVSDFTSIPSLGKKTRQRITEIIETGTLAELQGVSFDEETIIPSMSSLTSVSGFGPAKIREALAKNITLDMLLEDNASATCDLRLTNHQILGLKYYHDIQERLQREHIAAFDVDVHALFPELKIVVCGSYRRGESTSGDVDLLILNESDTAILPRIVHTLTDVGVLIDDLSTATHTKYMGFARLPGRVPACRIDIRVVPSAAFVPALLYFTGSKDENVRLRRLYKTNGMKLNEYGVTKIDTGTSIILQSEEDAYALIQEPFKLPHVRR
jgi:DNA polymerase/3'-5' exonuclease PolX